LTAWLTTLAAAGKDVLLGDPGRSYFPHQAMQELGRYSVPTTRALEDSDVRFTGVFRLTA
jgi:predicted nicotinamide N-methyase